MDYKQANFGVIGISGRGSSMLAELLSVEGVKVTAVCDKYEDRAQNGVKIVQEKAGNTPEMFLDYRELLKREDITAILCCTTWITHSRIAIDSMRAGKNAGSWSGRRKKRASSVCCLKTVVMTEMNWPCLICKGRVCSAK